MIAVAVLSFLVLVFEFAAKDGACYGTENAVAAYFVTSKVAGCTATESAHQSTIALGLCIGICWAVLAWLGLAIWVLALGVLVLGIGALLGKLVRWLLTRILA